ncbi:hypothetical protein C8Q76DRAFT_210935 [Earliella scabrosa]|nr:hypothetical protein C8Q76DRAFT_210935 [Earliella scabrosa]
MSESAERRPRWHSRLPAEVKKHWVSVISPQSSAFSNRGTRLRRGRTSDARALKLHIAYML